MSSTVLVVYDRKSHEKSTRYLVDFLKLNGFHVLLVNCNVGCQVLPKIKADALFISAGGRVINKIINMYRDVKSRPTIFSIFPGIVVKSQVEAFVSRLNCDYVLLNSRNDYAYYSKICKVLGVEFNGILYGAAWISFPLPRSAPQEKRVVFIEQLDIPHKGEQRIDLVHKLNKLAKKWPSLSFKLQARHPDSQSRPVMTLSSIYESIKGPASNFNVSLDDIAESISQASHVLTISSSAAMEAISGNKNLVIVNDYESPDHFLDFFRGSEIKSPLMNVNFDSDYEPNKKWLECNFSHPKDNIEKIVYLLKRQSVEVRRFYAQPSRAKYAIIRSGNLKACFSIDYKRFEKALLSLSEQE